MKLTTTATAALAAMFVAACSSSTGPTAVHTAPDTQTPPASTPAAAPAAAHGVYDPSANTSTMLLGPPVNGGGVIAAVAFAGQR